MFNGIIKNTGKIFKILKKKNDCILILSTKMRFSKTDIGSSISCSGACLTLEKSKKNLITFYVSKETLIKTIFKSSKKGDMINLEKPLKYGESVSGHFVQGHTDTTCRVSKIKLVGKSCLIRFNLSRKFRKYIVTKGSIAINGVSLTVAKLVKNGFEIAIIPKTLQLTNLTKLKKKDLVNVEFDVLGKYIKNLKK